MPLVLVTSARKCYYLVFFVHWHNHFSSIDKAFNYSVGNGSTTLRRHLLTFHPTEFLEHCNKNSIPIKDGGLSEKQKSKVTTMVSRPRRELFTPETFKSALVSLIVANDLVSWFSLFFIIV